MAYAAGERASSHSCCVSGGRVAGQSSEAAVFAASSMRRRHRQGRIFEAMRNERAPTAGTRRPAARTVAQWELFSFLLLLATCQAVRSVEASGAPQPPLPDCPEVHVGRRLYVLDNKCYEFVVSRPSTWLKAYEFCEERGGQLVQIKSELVQNFLARRIEALGKDYQEKSYWIGANDRKSEGVWQWTDGTRLSYTKWFAKLPRTSCGGAGSSGSSSSRQCPEQADCAIMKPKQQYRWFDSQCRSPDQAFICEQYYVSSAASTTTTLKPPQYGGGGEGNSFARAPGDRGSFSSALSPQMQHLTPSPMAAASTTPSGTRTIGGGDWWQHAASSLNTSRNHWSPLRYLLLSIHALDSQVTLSSRVEDSSDLSKSASAVVAVTEMADGRSRAGSAAPPVLTVAYSRATTATLLARTRETALLESPFRVTSRSAAAQFSESPPVATASSTAEQSAATLTAKVNGRSSSPAVTSVTAAGDGHGWHTQRPPARRANSAIFTGSGVGVVRATVASTLAERRRGNSASAASSDELRSGTNRPPPPSTFIRTSSAVASKLNSTRAFTGASPSPASNVSRKDGSVVEVGSATQGARMLSEVVQQSNWNEDEVETTTLPVTAATKTVMSENDALLDVGSVLDNPDPHQQHQGHLDGDGLDVLPAADDTDWDHSSPHHVGGSEISGGGATATAARLDLTAVIASASTLGVVVIALTVTAAIVVLKRRRLKNGRSSISPSSPLSSSPPSTVDYAGHRRGQQWFARAVTDEHCSAPATGCQMLQPEPAQSTSSAKQGPLPETPPT